MKDIKYIGVPKNVNRRSRSNVISSLMLLRQDMSSIFSFNAHLLVLGAYRESEIEQNPVFAHTIAKLTRQRILATIPIDPLSAEETGMLAITSLVF